MTIMVKERSETHEPVHQDSTHLLIDELLSSHVGWVDMVGSLEATVMVVDLVDVGGHQQRIAMVSTVNVVHLPLHIGAIRKILG